MKPPNLRPSGEQGGIALYLLGLVLALLLLVAGLGLAEAERALAVRSAAANALAAGVRAAAHSPNLSQGPALNPGSARQIILRLLRANLGTRDYQVMVTIEVPAGTDAPPCLGPVLTAQLQLPYVIELPGHSLSVPMKLMQSTCLAKRNGTS